MRRSWRLTSGATGIRTPDLLHAMQTRYQLRHSPAKTQLYRRPQTGPNRPGRRPERSTIVAQHHLGQAPRVVLDEPPTCAPLFQHRPTTVRQATEHPPVIDG